MKLKDYLDNKPRGFRAKFAKKLGISPSFLCQIENNYAKAPVKVAKKIEELTNKEVNKSELLPHVFG